GDAELARALAPRLDGHRTVAVALREADGSVRVAGFGADERREFEIGSVSKPFTGGLLAEAVARGEVTVESTVAELLGAEADGSDIADVTLAELATHTSGLPRLAPGMLLAGWLGTLRRTDPYAGTDAAEVIDAALALSPDGRGEQSYSNLGVALLGQLLARTAGTDYAALLSERILTPLGLEGTYAPITAGGLRRDAPHGHTSTGLGSAPWTLNGYAPPGGSRSTAEDMAAYLAAGAHGTAPGAAAATEVLHEASGERTAMTWFLEETGGTPLTWHNGMTGGFAAFAGFVPDSGRGLVILTDTARSVDEVARDVLSGEV